mmetsp:Transcript_13317/g.19595  ORF Transcript_13317/g.19595 Transcript_13317/m.19595 type:complete len:193 (-) Transcript_13317:61-639(-)
MTLILMSGWSIEKVEAFGVGGAAQRRFGFGRLARETVGRVTRDHLAMTTEETHDDEFSDENGDGDAAKGEDEDMEDEFGDPNVQISEMDWRVAKLKLEEAHTRSFLKSGPRHLPYEECRKWVAAWNRWSSEEEWREWIDMGEKRNAYIPARPDEYYGRLGQWISWEHFLGVDNGCDGESSSSNSDEPIGAFD